MRVTVTTVEIQKAVTRYINEELNAAIDYEDVYFTIIANTATKAGDEVEPSEMTATAILDDE